MLLWVCQLQFFKGSQIPVALKLWQSTCNMLFSDLVPWGNYFVHPQVCFRWNFVQLLLPVHSLAYTSFDVTYYKAIDIYILRLGVSHISTGTLKRREFAWRSVTETDKVFNCEEEHTAFNSYRKITIHFWVYGQPGLLTVLQTDFRIR